MWHLVVKQLDLLSPFSSFRDQQRVDRCSSFGDHPCAHVFLPPLVHYLTMWRCSLSHTFQICLSVMLWTFYITLLCPILVGIDVGEGLGVPKGMYSSIQPSPEMIYELRILDLYTQTWELIFVVTCSLGTRVWLVLRFVSLFVAWDNYGLSCWLQKLF